MPSLTMDSRLRGKGKSVFVVYGEVRDSNDMYQFPLLFKARWHGGEGMMSGLDCSHSSGVYNDSVNACSPVLNSAATIALTKRWRAIRVKDLNCEATMVILKCDSEPGGT